MLAAIIQQVGSKLVEADILDAATAKAASLELVVTSVAIAEVHRPEPEPSFALTIIVTVVGILMLMSSYIDTACKAVWRWIFRDRQKRN